MTTKLDEANRRIAELESRIAELTEQRDTLAEELRQVAKSARERAAEAEQREEETALFAARKVNALAAAQSRVAELESESQRRADEIRFLRSQRPIARKLTEAQARIAELEEALARHLGMIERVAPLPTTGMAGSGEAFVCGPAEWAKGRKCCPDCTHPRTPICEGCDGECERKEPK